jgi:DNA-binding MarR family transcriptional regulator
MLDSKSTSVLIAVNTLCQDGYKVLSLTEILYELPKEVLISQTTLCQTLSELEYKGYLSIKYQDDSEVCLSTLPKARLFLEQTATEIEQSLKDNRLNFKNAFFGSLCGGLLSDVIITVVLFIIK